MVLRPTPGCGGEAGTCIQVFPHPPANRCLRTRFHFLLLLTRKSLGELPIYLVRRSYTFKGQGGVVSGSFEWQMSSPCVCVNVT